MVGVSHTVSPVCGTSRAQPCASSLHRFYLGEAFRKDDGEPVTRRRKKEKKMKWGIKKKREITPSYT
jgi:hypothetical protein